MKKSDIEFHSDGFRPANPAVCVKRYSWPRASQLAAALECSEGCAQAASELAWQAACENFWEQAQEQADHHLQAGKVYSEGRSSGWLVVHDLPPVESWDALAVSRWSHFAAAIEADIAYRALLETATEAIRANEWHKPGAEQYNFVERADGSTGCIADLKAEAIAAGFGPVTRN